jgi:hypothetical protein
MSSLTGREYSERQPNWYVLPFQGEGLTRAFYYYQYVVPTGQKKEHSDLPRVVGVKSHNAGQARAVNFREILNDARFPIVISVLGRKRPVVESRR